MRACEVFDAGESETRAAECARACAVNAIETLEDAAYVSGRDAFARVCYRVAVARIPSFVCDVDCAAPGVDWTEASPPCARARCLTMASPRPVPPSARERARSTR